MIRAFIAAFLLLTFTAISAEAQDRGPTPVFVTEVEEVAFADRIEALGTLRANESITVTSSVADLVTEINFDDGQRVEKGDILLELASGEEKAQLQEQQSTLNEAKRQIERLEPLVSQGAASQSLLDERQREYQTALARVNAIKARLNDYIITAPFSGIVGLRYISTGALLQPGNPITTLDDDSVMKLDFSVPSVYLSALKIDLPITARTKSYPDREFDGVIASIGSQVDPVTRSVQVRALIPNNKHILKPGLLMNIDLFKDQRQALIIPEEALLSEGESTYVFVIQKDEDEATVEKRPIKTGTRRPGTVEVLSGLETGDQIVTHGTHKLQDDSTVKITGVEKDNETLEQLLDKSTQNSAAQTMTEDDAP
ncbi:MAG: efflux RND transporter periplasmic adaptor subunit [Pseudomonadota bacterium]